MSRLTNKPLGRMDPFPPKAGASQGKPGEKPREAVRLMLMGLPRGPPPKDREAANAVLLAEVKAILKREASDLIPRVIWCKHMVPGGFGVMLVGDKASSEAVRKVLNRKLIFGKEVTIIESKQDDEKEPAQSRLEPKKMAFSASIAKTPAGDCPNKKNGPQPTSVSPSASATAPTPTATSAPAPAPAPTLAPAPAPAAPPAPAILSEPASQTAPAAPPQAPECSEVVAQPLVAAPAAPPAVPPAAPPAATPAAPAAQAQAVNTSSLAEFCAACHEFEAETQELEQDLGLAVTSRGIVNNGNSCYRNAVIQGLLAVPRFSALALSLVRRFPRDKVPRELVCFREVLALTYAMRPVAGTSGTAVTAAPGAAKQSQPPVNLAELMPRLCQSFQQKVAAMRGPAPKPRGRNGAVAPAAPAAASSGTSTTNNKKGPSGSQEDAMEFLTFLLDTIHEELSGGEGALPDFLAAAASRDVTSADQAWSTVGAAGVRASIDDKSLQSAARAGAASSICRMFFSRVRQEVVYLNKKKVSVTYSPCACLSLEIDLHTLRGKGGGVGATGSQSGGAQGSSAPATLEECLRAYFTEETASETKIGRLLDSFPPTLLLQLKRFGFDQRREEAIKLHSELVYPLQLTLDSALCSADLLEREGERQREKWGFETSSTQSYKLTAVVLHHGQSAQGGHYSTVALGHDAQWRHYNDSSVEAVTEASVLGARREAYLLFYVRCGCL